MALIKFRMINIGLHQWYSKCVLYGVALILPEPGTQNLVLTEQQWAIKSKLLQEKSFTNYGIRKNWSAFSAMDLCAFSRINYLSHYSFYRKENKCMQGNSLTFLSICMFRGDSMKNCCNNLKTKNPQGLEKTQNKETVASVSQELWYLNSSLCYEKSRGRSTYCSLQPLAVKVIIT